MVPEPKSETFTFIDMETTDLSPDVGIPLEVGFRIYDLELKEIDRFSHVVYWPQPSLKTAMDKTPEFVFNMHRDNGLWAECSDMANRHVAEFDRFMYGYMTPYKGEILCGSSLKLDRDFLEYWFPLTAGLFHYRSIDNSSTKELCKRLNPDLYAKLPDFDTDHRVDTCLDGTIEEFKFYLDNFLIEGD